MVINREEAAEDTEDVDEDDVDEDEVDAAADPVMVAPATGLDSGPPSRSKEVF